MALLILEDGREFCGKSIGADQISFGEIVFNTGMTGYQETLTDPSYAGQIITFTYPEIGNYGCNLEDIEASGTNISKYSRARGMVIRNYSPIFSSHRAKMSLDEFLKQENIPCIYDIDTRALTRHLRDKGAMKAVIVPDEDRQNLTQVRKELEAQPSMAGSDLASEVTTKEKYQAGHSLSEDKFIGKKKIIAFDFGIKQNILNKLLEHGFDVEVVPASTPASYVIEQNPDGVFLSNGPGDPEAVSYAIETVKTLVQDYSKPIFGICLGHQILSLAAGASSYKLKFGHRGANQPIKNLENQKIEIASHNHGFAVSKEKLPENLEITHLNINDDTVAGVKLKSRDNVFSVQYHPEASPGPHDSDYLFKQFSDLMV